MEKWICNFSVHARKGVIFFSLQKKGDFLVYGKRVIVLFPLIRVVKAGVRQVKLS